MTVPLTEYEAEALKILQKTTEYPMPMAVVKLLAQYMEDLSVARQSLYKVVGQRNDLEAQLRARR